MAFQYTVNVPHGDYDWDALRKFLDASYLSSVPEIGKENEGEHYHGLMLTTCPQTTVRDRLTAWFRDTYDIKIIGKQKSVKLWTNGWRGAAYHWKENVPLHFGDVPDDLPSDEHQYMLFKQCQKDEHERLKKQVARMKINDGKKISTQWDFVDACVKQIYNKGLGNITYNAKEITDILRQLHLDNHKILPHPRDMVRMIFTVQSKLSSGKKPCPSDEEYWQTVNVELYRQLNKF